MLYEKKNLTKLKTRKSYNSSIQLSSLVSTIYIIEFSIRKKRQRRVSIFNLTAKVSRTHNESIRNSRERRRRRKRKKEKNIREAKQRKLSN